MDACECARKYGGSGVNDECLPWLLPILSLEVDLFLNLAFADWTLASKLQGSANLLLFRILFIIQCITL